MKIDTSQSQIYVKLDTLETHHGTLAAWHCPKTDNPAWDAFLNSTPRGQYQQTSMWAQVRSMDGWQPLITIITLNDHIIGGFQILYRSKSFIGKIGYVLKGPVIASDDSKILTFVINTFKKTASRLNFRVLVIQTPDKHQELTDLLKQSGFLNNLDDFIMMNNTLLVDLHGSEEEVFKKIKRQKRQNINTAKKNGVTVREGNREDIKTFFNYMLETCKRQQCAPRPSNENFFLKLWDLFAPSGHMKLFMAQCEGTDVTGLVVLPFSDTAYMWKFGWSGNYGNYRPNEMLYWEIFKWAIKHGYLYADIGAVGTMFSPASVQNSGDSLNTFSHFKNEFGGEVVALSNGFIYIPNPLIRGAYNLLMPYINSRPSLKKKMLFSGE